MTEGEDYAGGLQLQFFDSAEFEEENHSNSTVNAGVIARNVIRILMMGWNESWTSLTTWQVFKAVFITRDPQLLRGMRLGFQQGFANLYYQLKEQIIDERQLNQAQLYIANCMNLLPFADLNPYESIAIPQWIDERWQMVDYKVTPIELTPTSGFRKLFINDEDRVFAYGLEPIANDRAEPHLIFMGTTYPAGQGFNTQVNTDLEAFETPGKTLYRHGRDKIANWLDKQGKKVHVCGTSLGGSLSLLLAIDQGEKLSRVDALNPTGLYEPWRKSRFDRWDEIDDKPKVLIQKQGNDPVSKFGVWKKEWDLLHVTQPRTLQEDNGFIDHALNYAGFEDTRFLGLDTEKDNASRKTRNFWLFTVFRSLAYLGHGVYNYLVLPLVRYVMNHKVALTIAAIFIVSAVLMPAEAAITFLIALSIPLGVYLIYKVAQAVRTVIGWDAVTEPSCHSPARSRNELLDTYKNNIKEVFTYKEIGDYYYARRCIIKGLTQEQFLPREAGGKKGSSEKRAVLALSQNPEINDETLVVTSSKAKIYDIKQTVALLNRFGFRREDRVSPELKEQLKEQHRAYTMGKN